MQKKPLAFVASMLLISLSVSVAAYAYSIEDYINVGEQTQAQSKWCWAACASAILDYYGSTVSQSSFVSYVRGSAVNLSATPQEVKDGLSHWGISSVLQSSYLSFDGIRAEINTYSRPIYSSWKWATSGGHAVVIDGYSSDSINKVDYMDPADGTFHFTTYTWVVGGTGYDHTWDQTLKSIHD